MAESPMENNGFTFLWKIENYSIHALSEKECFVSPDFVVGHLNHSKWRLKHYPFEYNCNCLEMEIEKLDGISETIVDISIHLLTESDPFFLGSINGQKFNVNDIFCLRFEKERLYEMFKSESFFLENDSIVLKCHMWNSATKILPSVICRSLTSFPVEKHIFKWSLKGTKHYSSHVYKRILYSKTKDFPSIKLYLKNGYNNNSKLLTFFGLEVFNIDEQKSYRIKIKLSIHRNENEVLETLSENWFVEPKTNSKKINLPGQAVNLLTGNGNFTMNDIFKLCFDLTVACNDVRSQICNSSIITNPKIDTTNKKIKNENKSQEVEKKILLKSESLSPTRIGIDSLTYDLGHLLTEKKFCDVTLRTDGKEFFAHRALLASRSPVFNTMFESDMKEKETGVVNIDDIDHETFEIFLTYIYSGKIDKLCVENSVTLYSAAEKYQILALKKECSSFILNHLSAENVCEILILSDMYQDEELKKSAQDIFCIHSNAVFLTKEWVTLLEKKPKLGAEVLKELAKRSQ